MSELLKKLKALRYKIHEPFEEGSCGSYQSGICEKTGNQCERNGENLIPYQGPCSIKTNEIIEK